MSQLIANVPTDVGLRDIYLKDINSIKTNPLIWTIYLIAGHYLVDPKWGKYVQEQWDKFYDIPNEPTGFKRYST